MTAALYGYLMCRVFDPVMRGLREQVARLADVKAGAKVLDVCCGTGSQVLHFAEANVFATGVDLDPRMTRLAEKSRRTRGLMNASFQTASALALPFSDGTFDCASISMALHEMEGAQRGTVVSEMKRVVVEYGDLVFTDYAVPLPHTPSAYVSWALEYIAGRENYRCFRDYVQRGGLKGFLAESEVRQEKTTQLGPLVVMVTRNAKG